jgi:pyrroline-5-carboxylate reductase
MAGPVLLVGCGRMGNALLGGWLDRGFAPGDIRVVEPVESSTGFAQERGVAVHADASVLHADFSPAVIVFAVKPQSMDEVAPAYRRFAVGGSLFLSIAAGKTIGYFENILGRDAAVCRAMPNTPAAVRRGITVLAANDGVDTGGRAACAEIMAAVGEVAWVEDESLMDAVTGVSGSGPGYVFLFTECLANAGVAAGLPKELSAQLARATVAGSGALLAQSPESPEQLRKNVTSPGGTTQAALDVFMADDGMQPLVTRAVAAATRRSKELAG